MDGRPEGTDRQMFLVRGLDQDEGSGKGLPRAADAYAEGQELKPKPDLPLPLGLQTERMQKILEGNGEHETGKDTKDGSLSLQLGILR